MPTRGCAPLPLQIFLSTLCLMHLLERYAVSLFQIMRNIGDFVTDNHATASPGVLSSLRGAVPRFARVINEDTNSSRSSKLGDVIIKWIRLNLNIFNLFVRRVFRFGHASEISEAGFTLKSAEMHARFHVSEF